MDIPDLIEVFFSLDDQDRPRHHVRHCPDLPEEVPLHQGIHEVPHSLPLHEDAVADGVIAKLETLQRDRRPEFVQAHSDP